MVGRYHGGWVHWPGYTGLATLAWVHWPGYSGLGTDSLAWVLLVWPGLGTASLAWPGYC